MPEHSLVLTGCWHGRWRLWLGARVIRIGAWLAEGAGCKVSMNDKPWREYKPEVTVEAKATPQRSSRR